MEKKRVLHIITRIIVGGAQFNTMYSCDLIDTDKYEASILTGPQTGPEGSIEKDIRDRNIPLTIMPEMVREINPVKDFIALFKLYFYLRKNKFDVVHTHSSKAGIIGRLAAFFARVPVIVHTVHGWGFHDEMSKFTRGLYVFLEKLVEPMTHKLIVVSDLNMEKGLEENISKKEKYITIHSGIDVEAFESKLSCREDVRKELGIKDDELVVGNVSRLSPQKAPEIFIEVAKRVHKDYPKVKFLFAGDGPLREKCETLIDKDNLNDTVKLLGLRTDVPRIMSSFDIFILTSLWEGLPRVFPESMAMNLPIVATNVDGAPQAITDGENGYLIPPADVEMFVDRLIKLISDNNLRDSFSKKAKEKVRPKFCVKQMVRDIEKVYEEFL